MAILNFPNEHPGGGPLQEGDTYTGDNGVLYTYDGVKWLGRSLTSSMPLGTRWDATAAEPNGCPIFTELTPDHFEAYTQRSHIQLQNNGYWDIGSNLQGNGVQGYFDGKTTVYSDTSTVVVRTSGINEWTFGTDGILTLPGGNTQISNQGMSSTSSSVVLASMGATGGAALEWISDPELSTSTKIAFVIANNPLSANSGTVQIATGRITFNGPEEPPVLENVWDFGTNGTLTIPDDIQDANGSVVRVATTSTAPTRVNGQLWYNNIEGRMYIRYSDLWVDASPTIIPPISTYLDGLSVEGTTISALDSTASIYVSGNLVVDGNVISNNQILLDRLTTGSNSVVLGSDGLLTLPGLMTLPVTTSTPAITTATGTVAVCDGTGWDGGGDGFQHLMIYINNTWTKVI